MMFDRICSGFEIWDMGQVQYNYLMKIGLIEPDEYLKFIARAALVSRAYMSLEKAKQKPGIIDLAKLMCLTNFYREIRKNRKHINEFVY